MAVSRAIMREFDFNPMTNWWDSDPNDKSYQKASQLKQLNAEEAKERDTKAANNAKPKVPDGVIYDFRFCLSNRAISGWKGPVYSSCIYLSQNYGQLCHNISTEIKQFIINSDKKNFDKMRGIQRYWVAVILLACIVLFIINSVTNSNSIALIICAVGIGIVFSIYFYLFIYYSPKVIYPQWKENVSNNLQTFVRDLRNKHVQHDSRLVFSLIKIIAPVGTITPKKDWYVIRIYNVAACYSAPPPVNNINSINNNTNTNTNNNNLGSFNFVLNDSFEEEILRTESPALVQAPQVVVVTQQQQQAQVQTVPIQVTQQQQQQQGQAVQVVQAGQIQTGQVQQVPIQVPMQVQQVEQLQVQVQQVPVQQVQIVEIKTDNIKTDADVASLIINPQ